MLTQEDHQEMRRLRGENPKQWTHARLGEKFGVCRQRVAVIIDQEAYKKQLATYRRWWRRKHDNPSTGLL